MRMGMRGQSEIVPVIIMVAVAIVIVAFVSNLVVSGLVKSFRPRGETIEYNVAIEVHNSTGRYGSAKISVLVSCSGHECDKYSVYDICVHQYSRSQMFSLLLSCFGQSRRLKSGLTRVEGVVYIDRSTGMDEMLVQIILLKPDNTTEEVYRSVQLR